MELVFVRHGQPGWAEGGTPQMDPALTEVGLRQAELCAERLASRGADEIISSPARRARETAAPLAARLGKPVTVIEDLTEIRLPDWSHLSLMEVAHTFRKAREREPAAWWEGIPGGESFRAFTERVQRAVHAMLADRGMPQVPHEEAPIFGQEKDPGRLVVFGHGGTNAVAMTVLLGISGVPWEWERFTIGHAGMVRLKAIPLGRGMIFSMKSFNDREHLPKDLRTT